MVARFLHAAAKQSLRQNTRPRLECFVLHVPLFDPMRKPLVLVVAVLIIGVVPATAVIGFCAKMPCCFAHQREVPVELTAANPDCCNSISCAETPAQEFDRASSAKSLTQSLLVFPEFVAVVPAAPALLVRDYHDLAPPPPTARQRLSVLSLLLI